MVPAVKHPIDRSHMMIHIVIVLISCDNGSAKLSCQRCGIDSGMIKYIDMEVAHLYAHVRCVCLLFFIELCKYGSNVEDHAKFVSRIHALIF